MATPSPITEQLIAELALKFEKYYEEEYNSRLKSPKLSIKAGARYDKIILTNHENDGQRVFAFLDKSNNGLLKPASWKAPAKGVRYSLHDADAIEHVVSIADPYGRFLYVR